MNIKACGLVALLFGRMYLLGRVVLCSSPMQQQLGCLICEEKQNTAALHEDTVSGRRHCHITSYPQYVTYCTCTVHQYLNIH
jgi:hypothetical protein